MKLVDTIADLRRLLFSKYLCGVSKLPPTMSALKYRTFRPHYAALILKTCTSSIQNLPDPNGIMLPYNLRSAHRLFNIFQTHVELDNGNLVPIMTNDRPVPTGLIELTMRSCKTGSSSGRCTCKKSNLLCTEMCSGACEISNCNEKEDIYESEDEISDSK